MYFCFLKEADGGFDKEKALIKYPFCTVFCTSGIYRAT